MSCLTRELISEDETYKFIIKTLGIRFHRHLGYDGDSIEFKNVELNPLALDNKLMDILYEVDGKYNRNIELQSTPVYDSKLNDMYKYAFTPNVRMVNHSRQVFLQLIRLHLAVKKL